MHGPLFSRDLRDAASNQQTQIVFRIYRSLIELAFWKKNHLIRLSLDWVELVYA